MLILLPPSEGKTAPASGVRADLAAVGAPQLAAARRRVAAALREVSGRSDALAVLGVGRTVADDVARNLRLREEPAAPAAGVYTGVLYAAAGLAELTGTAAERAARNVRIVSALFGALSPADPIPAYRLAMGTDLPGIGKLARFWRPHLRGVLDARAAGDVVVDCRSAAYAAAWTPPADAEHVTVGVVRETDRKRTVVSHHAKHTRGLLTRHLLTREAAPPRTAAELADAAAAMPAEQVRDVELTSPARPGKPFALTLVV